jgi:hypothetical protein
MDEDEKNKPRLEIAHVLFMDIVGYSKLLTDEQSEALQELNQIVRNTEVARAAEAAGQLMILPTGAIHQGRERARKHFRSRNQYCASGNGLRRCGSHSGE